MLSLTHLNVVSALQASIAPVTLISAVGFLSLVTSGRYGRVIDRLRVLLRQLYEMASDAEEYPGVRQQVDILFRRANNLRRATVMAGWSIFCTAFTIFMLFTNLMFNFNFASYLAETAFIFSLVLLLVFILFLIRDFGIALHAVKFEMEIFLNSSKNIKHLKITTPGDEP